MIARKALISSLVVTLVGACSSASTEEDSFTEGKLSNNGLVMDFTILDGLSSGPLGAELAPTDVDEDRFGTLLSSANGRELFSYVVTCALREDQSLHFASSDITYSGNLGLADHWPSAECDPTCQRWISACVLAHTNAFGESVTVSPRGAHPSLSWNTGIEKEFDYEEAAYYGNLFLPQDQRFAAVCGGDTLYEDSMRIGELVEPSAVGSVFLEGRIHGGGTDDILFTGTCNSLDLPGVPTGLDLGAACRSRDGGYYSDCSTSEDPTELSLRVAEVITVFLTR